MRTLSTVALLLAVSFISQQSSAQENYKDGLVVINNGDTLHGTIDYRQWERNPDNIRFREAGGSGRQVGYGVNDITYFEITGLDRYERAIISKDIRPVELHQLERFIGDSTITDTVFLRQLIGGKLALYQFVDSKQHFYIREEGNDYQELIYKVYLTEYDSRLLKMFTFRDQLKQWIPVPNTNRQLSSLLENAEYNEKKLTRIVEIMNQERGNAIAYKVKKAKHQASFYAGAGGVYSAMKLSGRHENLSKLEYTSGFKPMAAAGVDLAIMRDLQRLIIRFELAWYSLEYEGVTKPNAIDSINFRLKVNSIAPSISFLYNVVNSTKNKVYLGAGIAYNFSSYPENRLVKRYSNATTINTLNKLEMQKSWLSLHARAGYMYNNKFELATAMRFAGTFSNFSSFSFTPSIITAGINYHF